MVAKLCALLPVVVIAATIAAIKHKSDVQAPPTDFAIELGQQTTWSFQFPPKIVTHAHDQIHLPLKVINATDSSVKINRIETSCGCATARMDRDTIDPGREQTLLLTLKDGNASGLKSVTGMIHLDGLDPVEFVASTLLLHEVEVEGVQIIDAGKASVGRAASTFFHVNVHRADSDPKPELRIATSPEDGSQVQVSDPTTTRLSTAHVRYRFPVDLQLPPRALPGEYSHELVITPDSAVGRRFSVLWKVVSPIQSSPSRIFLHLPLHSSNKIERVINVTSSEKLAVSIVAWESTNTGIGGCVVEGKPNLFLVTIDPAAMPGRLASTELILHCQTPDKKEFDLKVPITLSRSREVSL
jgi:hypothetical protein